MITIIIGIVFCSILLKIIPQFKIYSITVLIILIILALFSIIGFMPNYSDGTRIGYVTKISTKGLLIKSSEGFMRSSNLGSTSTKGENGFTFSIQPQNRDIIAGILECKGKVLLSYNQFLVKPMKYDTQYMVYSFTCK